MAKISVVPIFPAESNFIIGQYSGAVTSGSNEAFNRNITLGFEPKLVVLWKLNPGNQYGDWTTANFAVVKRGMPFILNNSNETIKCESNGFSVSGDISMYTKYWNDANYTYLYLAFR